MNPRRSTPIMIVACLALLLHAPSHAGEVGPDLNVSTWTSNDFFGHYEHGLSTARFIYQLGEPVTITHWLQNLKDEPQTFGYNQSPFFEILIFRDDQLVWDQHPFHFFITGTTTFGPNERLQNVIEWLMIDLDDQPISPGVYRITTGFSIGVNPDPISITIIPGPATVFILLFATAFLRPRKPKGL